MNGLDYEWRLRAVMAEHGMFSTTSLHPLLKERGVELSPSQVYRLVAERPERLNLTVLMALIDILECEVGDLVRPVRAQAVRTATAQPSRTRASSSPTRDRDLGTLRPRRAEVLIDPDE